MCNDNSYKNMANKLLFFLVLVTSGIFLVLGESFIMLYFY